MIIRILYEDDHLLAVDKPAGIVSVPAPGIPEWKTLQGQVRSWAKNEGKAYKPYLLHRLDRESSGVLLLGKYPRDRSQLEAIFKAPQTQKIYLALVKGIPKREEGTIRFPLEARTAAKKVSALTHYKILKKLGTTSLLEVHIKTGRRHQIRKHLAKIGHPLVLDREYGDKRFNQGFQRLKKGKGRFFLHSWKFRFYHPFLKKELEVQAGRDYATF